LLKLAPLLTDPAAHGGDERDNFALLPGYAFSAPPGRGALVAAGGSPRGGA